MVRRVQDRVVETVAVQIVCDTGTVVRGVTQDLGLGGLFVRTPTLLPVGTRVDVMLHVIEPPLRVAAHVVHALRPDEARSLGRMPGIGIAFGELYVDAHRLLESHLLRVKASQARAQASTEDVMRIVVADGETRLLERLSTALGRAGFEVVTCSNGVEAYSACLHAAPDVVIADLHLPVLDGMRLLKSLGARPELAEVPVLMMSEDAGDLRRLQAYQHGVMDFLPKPFTVVELCIRVRRLAAMRQEKARRVVLRGELSKIGFGTLLSLLGHEQKSGVVAVTAADDMAWISLTAGRVVKARALGTPTGSFDTLMRILSWRDGHFEFTACDVQIADEVEMPTTQLLLEHARLMDEADRP
jgi:DNA-binding response OmpR family regulator/Tfp pilus assembly protein PilZ